MDKRKMIVLGMATVVGLSVGLMSGCKREEAKPVELRERPVETATMPAETKPDEAGRSRDAAEVVCRQLTATMQMRIGDSFSDERVDGSLVLELPGYRARQIVGAKVELENMTDSKGRSFISKGSEWVLNRPRDQRVMLFTPQVFGTDRGGTPWMGVLNYQLSDMASFPQEIHELSGRVRLLEIEEMVTADVRAGVTDWQKLTDEIDIKLIAGGSRGQMGRYVLRSSSGRYFSQFGDVPCVMGMQSMRATGSTGMVSGMQNGLTLTERSGVIGMQDSSAVLRIFIATKMTEHVVPFSFADLTKAKAGHESAGPTSESMGETTVTMAGQKESDEPEQAAPSADAKTLGNIKVRFTGVNYAITTDSTMERPMTEMTLVGSAEVDPSLKIMALSQPVIDKYVNDDGTEVTLPKPRSRVRQSTAERYGQATETQRYNLSCTWVDLPALPRRPQRIDGHLTVKTLDKTQAYEFEKMESGQTLALPGDATMKIGMLQMSRGSVVVNLEYQAPGKTHGIKAGNAPLTDVRVVDDQGEEHAIYGQMRTDASIFSGDIYRASINARFRLPTERTVAGLRVYFATEVSEKSIPFSIDMLGINYVSEEN